MLSIALRSAFVLVAFAFAAPGGAAAVAPDAPRTATTTAALCCKVTYNAAKTHVQVTGIVTYKGTPVLFSFHGPCASPAGPGRAYVKSRWIPLKEMTAGYHRIDIVQKVNGTIVYSKSPAFFVKGTAQLRKPTVKITAGPTGVTTGTSALFKYRYADAEKVVCRLDARRWQSCASLNWVRFDKLAPGPHVFTLRAYALAGKGYAEAKRSFVLSAPPPG